MGNIYNKRVIAKLKLNLAYLWPFSLILSACGSSENGKTSDSIIIGFSSDYVPPRSDFDQPGNTDANFKIIETT